MKLCGIYEIRCKSNGKCYIGSSIDILDRLDFHKSRLKNGKHENPKLQACWNKHEIESFEFSILELVDGDPKLAEQNWLDRTLCELNISPNADSPMRGRKHTDSAKKKLSLAGKGRVVSAETGRKIALANTGRVHPPRTKKTLENLRTSHLGLKYSDEHKARIREAITIWWRNRKMEHKKDKEVA